MTQYVILRVVTFDDGSRKGSSLQSNMGDFLSSLFRMGQLYNDIPGIKRSFDEPSAFDTLEKLASAHPNLAIQVKNSVPDISCIKSLKVYEAQVLDYGVLDAFRDLLCEVDIHYSEIQ